MASSWQSVKIDQSNMPLYLSVPESGGPVPGIVVVHGQSGLENFIKETTQMLALQGYVAVAPNLYHRDPADCKDDNPTRKARLRDTTIIKDIEGAIGFLKSHSRVDALRSDERDSLPDPGPFRRGGQESVARRYAKARYRADKIQ